MTANQLAYDRAVDRVIAIDLYETGVLNKMQTAVDNHFNDTIALLKDPRLAQADHRAFSSLLDLNRNNTKELMTSTLERSLSDLSNDQVSFQVRTIDRIIGKFWETQRPKEPLNIEQSKIYFGKTAREGISGIFDLEQNKINKLVLKEIRKGTSPADAAKILEGSKLRNYLKTNFDTLGTTAITGALSEADFAVLKENEIVIKGWQYVAILDLHTSSICRYRAGKIFRVDQKGLYPPAHYRCRSRAVMIFKSVQELAKEKSPHLKARSLARATKLDFAKFDGEAVKGQSYNDWIRKQPLLIKLKHLGSQMVVNAVEAGKLKASEVINSKGGSVGINKLKKLTAEDNIPGMTKTFAGAKDKLDNLNLNARGPDDFIRDKKLQKNLKEFYQLQAGELDGTLSLTDYRGQLIHVKAGTKKRVLASPPTEDQMIFNPFTSRYEDARLYRPNPAVLANAQKLVNESADLLDRDKKFINDFVDSLSDKFGSNQRAVIADNLRITFGRARKNNEPWLNFKGVSQAQIKFDVMNISEALETRVRKDADFLKKFMQSSYIDPVLGDVQLQELHDTFIPNVLKRNNWEDTVAPKISRELRNVFDYKIPPIIRNRLSDRDLQQFYLRFAHRLGLADGPDRDQFAVDLGRDLYNQANLNGTKNDWFATGNKLLEAKNVKRFFDVDTFGVQKRRLKSKLSGKYFGPYYDTLSYNIRVTDPRIQEYSLLNRKVELGLRLGVTNDKNRLLFRPGFKTYFVDRGILGLEDTRIPITSTSSFSEFPEELVNKDLADALNWASNAKYKVNKEFYDFSKKLLYFRDDKGKAEHFNDLNTWKKYLVTRSDTYERFKAMEWLAGRDYEFSNQPFVDHRLRIYDRGLIGPQSGETFRPFLNTAKAKPLGKEGFDSLRDQVGSFLGGLDDYYEGNHNSLTFSGRQAIFEKWRPDLVKIGNHMSRAKPDDIRSILESDLLSRIEGEDIGKAYRLALETSKIDNYLKSLDPKSPYSLQNLKRLDKYLTDFAIEQDASSSGAQIIALTTRNRALAELSNVVPTTQKRRLYDEIAASTFSDPEFTRINEKLGLTEKDLRKAAKAQNMVTFYGAGERTGAMNVEAKLSKVLGKQEGTLVVKAADRDKVLDEISARAARYQRLDPVMFEELSTLRKKIKTVFDEGLDPGDDLLEQLYFLNSDTKEMVDKLSSSYEKVVTPTDFRDIAKIMSKHLADQAPITKDFTKFLGNLAAEYLENAKPGNADFDWSKIVETQIVGKRGQGHTLHPRLSEILGLKAGEPISEKLLKRFEFWEPDGTLANIILGAKEPKNRRVGAKYFKTEFLQLKTITSFELFTANKLPKAWTNVPWVNFDGSVIEQNFTQRFETRLTYKNAQGEWVKNILQIAEKTSATWWEQFINKSGKINDVADLNKARTAFAVNG